jgi:hypothetical protein
MLAPFGFLGGAGIDAQAQAHYNRVIADGGLIPSGLVGVNNFFTTVKGIYGTSDITTAISVGLDAQVLGYKLGAGAGTTSGQAAQKLYSCSGSSGDVVQTTAASQPLLLVHSGANYFYTSGETGNYCSTPNAAANQITGDIEIICYNFNINDLTVSGGITGKYTGGNISWLFYYNGNNTFSFFSSQNGISQSNSASANAGLSININYTLKVVRQSVSGDVLFYKSTDNGATFTQIGSNVASTAGNLFNSTYSVSVGGYSNGSDICKMKIGRVTISNSIGGAPVVDFNPSQYNAANSQTQWVSTTGETWTINTGTAATGYKGALVTKTIVMSDGVDDFISVTGLTSRQYFTRYVACIPYTNPNTAPRIISGNADTHLIFKTGTGAFEAFNGLQLAFTGELVNILQALIVDYNSTNSKTFVNNAGETSGSTGTTSSTAVSLFGSVTGTTLSNAVINTVIQPISVDNSTTRTAMYNYIRSINNNAF